MARLSVVADSQVQESAPVTARLAGNGNPAGAMTKLQLEPVCVTVKVWPPMLSVAERGVELGLSAALNATEPGPLPLAPDVTVSHAASLDAVHAQPLATLTETEPLPPAAAIA